MGDWVLLSLVLDYSISAAAVAVVCFVQASCNDCKVLLLEFSVGTRNVGSYGHDVAHR